MAEERHTGGEWGLVSRRAVEALLPREPPKCLPVPASPIGGSEGPYDRSLTINRRSSHNAKTSALCGFAATRDAHSIAKNVRHEARKEKNQFAGYAALEMARYRRGHRRRSSPSRALGTARSP